MPIGESLNPEISNDKSKNTLREVNTLFENLEFEDRDALEDKIYQNYASAMALRNRVPLEEDRFKGHFFYGGNFETSRVFGSEKNGFLLGSLINGVFVPTHFAPENLRAGYRLIKDLLSADTPTALFITQDLVDTIKKMKGWKILPLKRTMEFRGESVDKFMVVSQWSAVIKLLSHVAKNEAQIKTWRVRSRLSTIRFNLNKLINVATSQFKATLASPEDVLVEMVGPEDEDDDEFDYY